MVALTARLFPSLACVGDVGVAVARCIVLGFRTEEMIIFSQIRRTPVDNVHRTYRIFKLYSEYHNQNRSHTLINSEENQTKEHDEEKRGPLPLQLA